MIIKFRECNAHAANVRRGDRIPFQVAHDLQHLAAFSRDRIGVAREASQGDAFVEMIDDSVAAELGWFRRSVLAAHEDLLKAKLIVNRRL